MAALRVAVTSDFNLQQHGASWWKSEVRSWKLEVAMPAAGVAIALHGVSLLDGGADTLVLAC